MPSATSMTAEEYLHTSWEHDPDFVDGIILERFGTTFDHGSLQAEILVAFAQQEEAGHFDALLELTIHTGPRRYRVADICLLSKNAPREQIIETAPILCVEILAEEDQLRRALDRIRDFLRMGVTEVWVFDPISRTVQICKGDTVIEYSGTKLVVPGTTTAISLAEVLNTLDR